MNYEHQIIVEFYLLFCRSIKGPILVKMQLIVIFTLTPPVEVHGLRDSHKYYFL